MDKYIPKVGDFVDVKKPHTLFRGYEIKYVDDILCVGIYKEHSEAFAIDEWEFIKHKTEDEKVLKELVNLIRNARLTCEPLAKRIIEAGYHNGPKVKPITLGGFKSHILVEDWFKNLVEADYIVEKKYE